MTKSEARTEITLLTVRLLSSGLAVATNPPILFGLGDKVRMSWPRAKDGMGTLTLQPFASLSEYQALLLGNHYTALLTDGALIQCSCDFKKDEMVAHRFCYYPCPLVIPDASYASDTDAWFDLLDSELYAEIRTHDQRLEDDDMLEPAPTTRLRLRSPIRFDYDPDGQEDGEPSCHLHINDANTRIPVHAAISLREFLRFVLSHFYPSHMDILDGFPARSFNRCITATEELQMHLTCRAEL